MRLLFIANDFPNPYKPHKGVFNLNLVRALAKQHHVSVVSPVPWVDDLQAIRNGAAEAGHFQRDDLDGIDVRYPRYYYPPGVLRNQYGWFYWQSVHGTVARMMKEHRPDAVVGYWAHPDGEAAVRAARLGSVPSAVMVGGSDVLVLTRDPGRRRQVVKVLQATDAVVCVSDDLRTNTLALGIPAHKVHVWDQGIDTRLFYPGERAAARRRLGLPEQGPTALWVGRMVPVKGLEVLIEATAILHHRGVPLRVCLVGEGPERERLEAYVAALGLSQSVKFVGAVAQGQLPDWYRAADFTVLPSRSEGIPNVLRESRACGTPFVASKVGGIAEIADELTDRLVPPGDAAALASAIASSVAAPPAEIRPASRSWDASAHALIQILISAGAPQDSIRRRVTAPRSARLVHQLQAAW
jgi:glycosyltransferase involved in cell wall biosynthesis